MILQDVGARFDLIEIIVIITKRNKCFFVSLNIFVILFNAETDLIVTSLMYYVK